MNKIYQGNEDAMKQFDITLKKEFAEVDARLLKAPILMYSNKKAYPSRGVWKPDKFRVPGSLQAAKTKHWSIINADKHVKSDDLFELVAAIRNEAAVRGIMLGEPLKPFPLVEKSADLQNYLLTFKNKYCKFVIIILPDNGPITYAHTKTTAEIDIGMLTQCLRSNTLRNKIIVKKDAATMTNLIQKINAKINGTNHTISKTRALEGGVCMLVGADVTHPGPQNPNQPSIAAVVSSQDHVNHFVYNTEIRLQDGNQELISDLNAIMQKQLIAFRKTSGRWPEKIFFFRARKWLIKIEHAPRLADAALRLGEEFRRANGQGDRARDPHHLHLRHNSQARHLDPVRDLHGQCSAVLHMLADGAGDPELRAAPRRRQRLEAPRLCHARRISLRRHVRLLPRDLCLRLLHLHRHRLHFLHDRLHVRRLRRALPRLVRHRQVPSIYP
ncbi:unnamed protein product [Trichogramma brassicae]|uniref:Piwi domain-containing protein n=1 Tax=Trichogramma brassicae TaxID=86971 RepID=A0A6H5IED8_9HYME|nr:unnamed protein product [Trichogramma brassicae]